MNPVAGAESRDLGERSDDPILCKQDSEDDEGNEGNVSFRDHELP
ncbi:MAG: hypothetical protein ACJAVK_001551 [Akkermansiaceae bacterium]|jgi:hypothetical protein